MFRAVSGMTGRSAVLGWMHVSAVLMSVPIAIEGCCVAFCPGGPTRLAVPLGLAMEAFSLAGPTGTMVR
jgi:hypothetical protein